jgi:FdhD protein
MTVPSVKQVKIIRMDGNSPDSCDDLVVQEEPLEIRLGFGPAGARRQKRISVTMRTPGHDLELSLGFLYGEGIVRRQSEVIHLDYCANVERPEEVGNVVKVELEEGLRADIERLDRNFYMTSSCGVCGKSSIEALEMVDCPVLSPGVEVVWNAEMIHQLPDLARVSQAVFRHTGGIHAATLFGRGGEALLSREDVGRHNAVDKVVGAMRLQEIPAGPEHLLLVSGRAGFELVQKTIMAGIPIMAAVGAPSSLAVELARKYNLTLLGFVRNERFNVYSGASRLGL